MVCMCRNEVGSHDREHIGVSVIASIVGCRMSEKGAGCIGRDKDRSSSY